MRDVQFHKLNMEDCQNDGIKSGAFTDKLRARKSEKILKDNYRNRTYFNAHF